MVGSGPMAAIVPTAAIASRHRHQLRARAAPTTPRGWDHGPPQPMGVRRAPQDQWALSGACQSPPAPEAGQPAGGQRGAGGLRAPLALLGQQRARGPEARAANPSEARGEKGRRRARREGGGAGTNKPPLCVLVTPLTPIPSALAPPLHWPRPSTPGVSPWSRPLRSPRPGSPRCTRTRVAASRVYYYKHRRGDGGMCPGTPRRSRTRHTAWAAPGSSGTGRRGHPERAGPGLTRTFPCLGVGRG